MSTDRKIFWSGVVISPVIIAFLWMLSTKEVPDVQVPVEQKPKSLLSIDFIPAEVKTDVSNSKILKISLDENASEQEVTFAEFKGKPVVLHFWATWCGSCVEEMPELDKFAEQFGDNMTLVVVAADKTRGKEAREFYKSKGIKNLEIYVDDKNGLATSMKISALPTTVFVSTQGKELGRIVGPIDWIGEPGKLINTHLSKRR